MSDLPWYSLWAGAGLCAGLFYARRRLADFCNEKTQTRMLLLALAAFVLGVGVSNLANWFFFPENLKKPLLDRISGAGFTFYPGMIAAVSFTALGFRLCGLSVKAGMGRVVGAFPLFHAVARVGCIFSGCCYGRLLGTFRFPSRETEILVLSGIFLALCLQKVKRPCIFYFTAYPVYRFFAEFLRGDDRGTLIPGTALSVSQQISLLVLLGLLIWGISDHFHTHSVRKESNP